MGKMISSRLFSRRKSFERSQKKAYLAQIDDEIASMKETLHELENGIPAYIFIPAPQYEDQHDDDSLSCESLKRCRFGERTHWQKKTLIRTPTFQLRKRSIPATLSANHKAVSMISSKENRIPATVRTVSRETDDDSMDGSTSHMDRPPRVPRRQKSFQSLASSSCSMPVVAVTYRAH